MNFLDGSLFPENQDKLVITAAPYGPEWFPCDYPEDIAVTMDEQIQKAVDCYAAGASVLHLHVRELDGKGSKRLSKFEEMLGRLRTAVPKMILQVGGSISFAPEPGQEAAWPGNDARHALALLYRASVESMAMRADVVLPPGATESECLRASRRMPDETDRSLFARMVRVWQYAAYASRLPEPDEFESLLGTLQQQFRWQA